MVMQVGEVLVGSCISSANFSDDGAYLRVGIGMGDIELWDVHAGQKLHTMGGATMQGHDVLVFTFK